MSEAATERRIVRLEEDAQALGDSIIELLDRTRANDRKLDRFERRMDRMEGRLDEIDGKLDEILRRLPRENV